MKTFSPELHDFSLISFAESDITIHLQRTEMIASSVSLGHLLHLTDRLNFQDTQSFIPPILATGLPL